MTHRREFRPASRLGWLPLLLIAGLAAFASSAPAHAQAPKLDELLSAVVRIKTFINPEGRTIENLGRERSGSGIVIDDDGHVLTIGYLMVEAHTAEITTNDGRTVPANVLGYDHESGFGLLKATRRLDVQPMPIGKSAVLKTGDPVLAASFGGVRGIAPAYVAARREFAGNWEYLVDEAIFTTPPHTEWSGAALISRDGKLVGVGSLIVPDTTGKTEKVPGNMYVPIDLLAPILDDLAADRRGRPAKPWLGVATAETHGRLFVERVTPGGPAAKAGLQPGDIIVGVGGAAPAGMADFYRKVWSSGNAGVSVPLDVLQGNDRRRVDVKSMNRLDYLRMKTTY